MKSSPTSEEDLNAAMDISAGPEQIDPVDELLLIAGPPEPACYGVKPGMREKARICWVTWVPGQ